MAKDDDRSNFVHLAAMWLHQHRDTISGAVVPALRSRFGLSNLEAIEATKVAHALAYPKVCHG